MFYSPGVSSLYGIGAGDFLRNYGPTAMEFGMLRWLEHEGYDVTYITDVDTLDHWVFANTGLKVGDVIPGLIGVEYNGTLSGVETPNRPADTPAYLGTSF